MARRVASWVIPPAMLSTPAVHTATHVVPMGYNAGKSEGKALPRPPPDQQGIGVRFLCRQSLAIRLFALHPQ